MKKKYLKGRIKMKKKYLKLFIIITILITLIGIIGFGMIKYFTFNPLKPNSGNFNNNKTFIDNQVYVYFHEDISFTKIKWFLIKINGKLDAEELSIINAYAITLNNTFATEKDIENYCNNLIKKYSNIIEDCSLNGITHMPSPDEPQ